MKLGIGQLPLVILIAIFLVSLPCRVVAGATVIVDLEEARPGTQIRVDGSGFPGGEAFQILLDGVNVGNGTTYGGGSMYRVLTLKRTISLGQRNITVVSGSVSGQTSFTVVPWTPSVYLSPAQLHTDEVLEICGMGYPPSAYYKVYLGSEEVLAGVTDSEGDFCIEYTLRKNATLGLQNVTVTATQYSGPPRASSDVNVTQWNPRILISPEEANPGGVIEIHGSGFPPSSRYLVKLDGYEVLTGTADPQGSLLRILPLPASLNIGSHALRVDAVEYSGPPFAGADLPVVQWPASITYGPGKARPGMNLSIYGSGFPPLASFIVRLDGGIIGSGTTSGGGTFMVYHYLPRNYTLGPHPLKAVVSGYAGTPTASMALDVTQWEMNASVTPEIVHPSNRLSILGDGFPPNATYKAYLDGATQIASGKSNLSGLVLVEYVLSDRIALGTHRILFSVEGYSGPPTLNVYFDVTQWSLLTTLTPATGRPGSWIYIQGEDYPPGSVYYIDIDGVQVAQGVVPQTATLGINQQLRRDLSVGAHELKISSSFYGIDPVILTLEILQWPMSLAIDPKTGLPGSSISLSGAGSPPGARLQVFWDGEYFKATDATQTGAYATELTAPASSDNSYHEIEIIVTGGYAGPPSVRGYYWLGYFSPTPTVTICDEGGAAKSTFFLGGDLWAKGAGYPASIQMKVHVVREGEPYLGENAIASSLASTDALGYLGLTRTGPLGQVGTFRAWIDVNANGLSDSNDLVSGSFTVAERPDVAVTSVGVGNREPTQGELVAVQVGLRNEGNTTCSGSIVLALGGEEVAASTYDVLESGAERVITVHWDTSSSPAGYGELQAQAQPLPGELDTSNNEMAGGSVTIAARPDLSVLWVIPDLRTIKKGSVSTIRSRFINNGEVTQTFRASILWGEVEIVHQDISLDPGESRALRFEWDTTAFSPGTSELVARAEVLPYERDPTDNQVRNGTMTLLPPNRLPSADAGGPYSAVVDEVIELDGTMSYDLDGTIVTFRWDFGDGESSFGSKVNHVYDSPGVYEVSLKVIDDDGAEDSSTTTTTVEGMPMHDLTLSVVDGVTDRPLVGAQIIVGGRTYYSRVNPIPIQLESGSWTIYLQKPGFERVVEVLEVADDASLQYPMDPMLSIYPCDAEGSTRFDYAGDEVVYVCLDAPDAYDCLLFVIGDGRASAGKPLQDESAAGFERKTTVNGTILFPVWSAGQLPGAYDLVLDVDSDGVYDPLRDVLQSPTAPAFMIPEHLVASLFVAALIDLFRRRAARIEA